MPEKSLSDQLEAILYAHKKLLDRLRFMQMSLDSLEQRVTDIETRQGHEPEIEFTPDWDPE